MQLAKEKGWFQEAGLDVEVQDGTGTISTIQLVGSGQVHVGQVQLGPMMVAKESLPNLMSFAGFVRTGDLAVMTDKKLNIRSPKELVGKKLICFTTSPWAPFIKPYLAANGIAPEQVNVVMVAPPTAVVATFSAGEGDGFLSVGPDSEPRVRKYRPVSLMLLQDAGIIFPSYGLIATKETLASRGTSSGSSPRSRFAPGIHLCRAHRRGGQGDHRAASECQARSRGPDQPDRDLPAVLREPDDQEPEVRRAGRRRLEQRHPSMQKIGLIKPGHQPIDYYTNDLS